MPAPTSVDGVKRFLGHVTYMSKFIPNLSAESEPLRRLLQQKIFVWDTDQQMAFETLKRLLTHSETLQYFDVTKPVTVQTDASTAGLGAVLTQDGRPVTYISRSLTPAESNYAPIELEALAIVFALTRLDQYIFGHLDVTVQTDHKPLIPIFKKPVFKASRRVQSMLLSLQRYSGVKLVWRPGSEQVTADLLSRDSKMETSATDMEREHAFTIAEFPSDQPMADTVYQEIRKATSKDKILQAIIAHVLQGWPDEPRDSLKRFSSFREELTVEDGVLYRGTRVVVPSALQHAMLDRLHSSHQGIAATLRRARLSVYWPDMKEDIVRRCLQCKICLRDAPRQSKEQLRSHHVPAKPWTKVGMDLFEVDRLHYVVIVDYTSDYFEYVPLPSQRSRDIIQAIKGVFARLGVPVLVHSDNAAYFTSSEFSDFANKWKFQHTTSSPHYPQSNGKAEAAVKICKRILRRCEDPFMALLEHRNTVSEGMSTSPVQRLLGRATRSTLPRKEEATEAELSNHREKEVKRMKVQERYNRTARELPPLKEGQPVMVKDYQSHKRQWKEATVMKQLSGRSYSIEMDGDLLRRNRRDLRPTALDHLPEAPEQGQHATAESMPESPIPEQAPAAPNPVLSDNSQTPIPTRRSLRERKRPCWSKDYECEWDA